MKKTLPVLLAVLLGTVIGAAKCDDDGKNVCEKAADIMMDAYKDACKSYPDCSMCDCYTGKADCGGDSSGGEGDGEEAKCEGDAKTYAKECVDNEKSCADQHKSNVDAMCSLGF